jgi:hypothetical protein
MAPDGPVLQERTLGGIVSKDTGRTKPAPEPAKVPLNPGVTGIAWTRADRRSGGRGGGQ